MSFVVGTVSLPDPASRICAATPVVPLQPNLSDFGSELQPCGTSNQTISRRTDAIGVPSQAKCPISALGFAKFRTLSSRTDNEAHDRASSMIHAFRGQAHRIKVSFDAGLIVEGLCPFLRHPREE